MTRRAVELDYHHVDAFTQSPFAGNPAAVYVLDDWLDDATLAAIAAEHNLSETAFVVPAASAHALRWFTPVCEVQLCGHATLAAAYVLLYCLDGFSAPLAFSTRQAGELGVSADSGMLWLDFPAWIAKPAQAPPALVEALRATPCGWQIAANHMAVFEHADTVERLAPDLRALARASAADGRALIATAPAGDGVADFVSRFFAPAYGNDEDPVTGSAHCTLAPYWAQRLGKNELVGRQLSRRGGEIACRVAGSRVRLGGHAVRYAHGRASIVIEDKP